MKTNIENPILAGFYPDPSICRVEDDFYVVTSSFSYFPGIPIFHSKDLVNWEQIGHVLHDISQVNLTYEDMSAGIFAPTIRYHKGTFYVIVTNMSDGMKNFIVTATNPRGPWSAPFVIEGAGGIDPSLFFDEDGRAYYTGTTPFKDPRYDHQMIWGSEIDLDEMRLIGESFVLWDGALKDAHCPEGPHLYKKDAWYYLLIAEGGTEHFHAITISRSRSLKEPFCGYEGNPILTHRHLGKMFPVCNVGHGDLVELKDGSWYMVMLASRLMDGYHKIMGRETFLAPVIWEDGWPVVSALTGRLEMNYKGPNLPNICYRSLAEIDDFEQLQLEQYWNHLGVPYENYWRIEQSKLYLKLLAKDIVPWEFHKQPYHFMDHMRKCGKTRECVSFVGRRQQHMHFQVRAKMEFAPEALEHAGLVVLQNNASQLRIECIRSGAKTIRIQCLQVVPALMDGNRVYQQKEHGRIEVDEDVDTWYFTIEGNGIYYDFYAGVKEEEQKLVANKIDGGFLGSETAGGFIGAYIGMFASGGGISKEKEAAFDWFSYREV